MKTPSITRTKASAVRKSIIWPRGARPVPPIRGHALYCFLGASVAEKKSKNSLSGDNTMKVLFPESDFS